MKVVQSFVVVIVFVLTGNSLEAQVKTVSADVDWQNQQATLKNTIEAEYIIRVGDVDLFGCRGRADDPADALHSPG